MYKHGLKCHPLYQTHANMMHRCYDEKYDRYIHYGGKGIKVCDEWHDVKEFVKWAESHHTYIEGLTIERNDINKDYCPENCCFIPRAEQIKNKSNTIRYMFNGKNMTLKEIADAYNIRYGTLYGRIKRGIPIETAVLPFNEIPKKSFGKRYLCFGENLTLMELSKKYNINYDTLRFRLYRGLTIEEAVTEKIGRWK